MTELESWSLFSTNFGSLEFYRAEEASTKILWSGSGACKPETFKAMEEKFQKIREEVVVGANARVSSQTPWVHKQIP
jgi:hypothetical protein